MVTRSNRGDPAPYQPLMRPAPRQLVGVPDSRPQQPAEFIPREFMSALRAATQAAPQATAPQATAPPQAAVAPQAEPQVAAPKTQLTGNPNVPRGYRNNNPLNIIDGSFARGQPGYEGTDGRFGRFASMDDGINAADRLLQSYADRGLNTPQSIIARWAPAGDGDNNPSAYAATIARNLGVEPGAAIDMANPAVRRQLIDAMATVENGRPMSPPKLADGGLIDLARKYADGGSVAGSAQVYDPAVIAAIAASIVEPQGYADGGTATGVSSDETAPVPEQVQAPRTFADLVGRYGVGDAMQMVEPLDDLSLGAGVLPSIGNYLRPVGQGLLEILPTVKNYAIDVATGPKPFTRLGSDISTLGSAVWEGVKEDPVGTVLDILPVVGEVRSAMDAHELRNKAEAAERVGDEKQAAMFRQLSALASAGAIPLAGMGVRAANRGVKLGVEGAEVAARAGASGVEQAVETAAREGAGAAPQYLYKPVTETYQNMPEPNALRTQAIDYITESINATNGEKAAMPTRLGLGPMYIVDSGVEDVTKKSGFMLGETKNANAARQLDGISPLLQQFPEMGTSPDQWAGAMSKAFGSREVVAPPYRFMKAIDSGEYTDLLRALTPGQVADADAGFRAGKDFLSAYHAGKMSVEDTGKLFMWGILSRGVNPFTHEGLFLDAFNGIEPYIQMAAKGEFTKEIASGPYKEWASTTAAKGSAQPGSGAMHNLNAFGEDFLVKMGRPDTDGVTPMQKLHNLMSDPNMTGRDIRREFAKFGEGVGIDNKVVSFILLATGRNDVMVLDRIQLKNIWDDGRYADVNIWDGISVPTVKMKDGTTKRFPPTDEGRLAQRAFIAENPGSKGGNAVVTGSSLAEATYGAKGILVYEALEDALSKSVGKMYGDIGRLEAASTGRFHWDTWVARSNQEASHGTLPAILKKAQGQNNPLEGVYSKQGDYQSYAYGAKYGISAEGQPQFTVPLSTGEELIISPKQYSDALDIIRKPSAGVIPNKNFKVTDTVGVPWYEREGVNRSKLDDILRQAAAGQAGVIRKALGGSISHEPGRFPGYTRGGYVQGYADGGSASGSASNSLADLYEKYYGEPTTRQRLPTYEEMGDNPVGYSSIYPPQYMSNQDPNVSPVASRALMSDAQRLALLGRRGPVTGADLPALEARGQRMMDNAMTVAGAANPIGIRAFHGSPHTFDRFNMAKLGTGEGAQAYGHGLYFAGNEGVARSYRDKLAGRSRPPEEILKKYFTPGEIVPSYGGGRDKVISFEPKTDGWFPTVIVQEVDNNGKIIGRLRSHGTMPGTKEINQVFAERNLPVYTPGSMYEVNLRTSPERLLDWDKPLGAQPQAVRGALARVTDLGSIKFGGDAYQALANQMADKKGRGNFAGASAALKEFNIDGIRYLDGGSRAAGQGSSNYVMFDDKLIELLRRYGLLGMVGGGGAAATGGKQAPSEEPTDYAQGGSVDSNASVLTSPDGKLVIVGIRHGEIPRLPRELRNNIRDAGNRHGFYYEGDGGDRGAVGRAFGKIDYKGSFDDGLNVPEERRPDFLYTLFSSNVSKTPKLLDRLVDKDKTILESLYENKNAISHNSVRGKLNRDDIVQFLDKTEMSDYSMRPATRQNIKAFLERGEAQMWPDNWQDFPNPAGAVARDALELRLQAVIQRGSGVYFLGVDNLPILHGLAPRLQAKAPKTQAPTEEQTDYAQGGSVDSAPVYDPAVIAAIAASITEDNYA